MLGPDRHVHVLAGRHVLEDLEHLLLSLERLEQPPERLPAPRLRLIGEVRDAADDHVRGPVPAAREPERVGDHQQEVVLVRTDPGRQFQQLRLRARVGLALQGLQSPLGPMERVGAPVLGPVHHLLVHPPVLADGEDHQGGTHVDQLEADQLLVRCARRNREPRVLGQPGQ